MVNSNYHNNFCIFAENYRKILVPKFINALVFLRLPVWANKTVFQRVPDFGSWELPLGAALKRVLAKNNAFPGQAQLKPLAGKSAESGL